MSDCGRWGIRESSSYWGNDGTSGVHVLSSVGARRSSSMLWREWRWDLLDSVATQRPQGISGELEGGESAGDTDDGQDLKDSSEPETNADCPASNHEPNEVEELGTEVVGVLPEPVSLILWVGFNRVTNWTQRKQGKLEHNNRKWDQEDGGSQEDAVESVETEQNPARS